MEERTHVGVIASQEVTQLIRSALERPMMAVVRSISWPRGTVAGDISHESPDLIVCEIENPSQAIDIHQEISTYWPQATVVSCESLKPVATDLATGGLLEASQQAGYQGHLNIDEVALQLPIFLRYAEQRRVADQRAHQIVHLKRLLDASIRMQSSLDRQAVAQMILSEFGQWVTADSWQLYAVSDDRKFIELLGSEGVRIKPLSLTLMMDGDGVIERILESGEMVAFTQHEVEQCGEADLESTEELVADSPRGMVLYIPLVADDQVIGVVQATRIHRDDEVDAEFTRDETARLWRISPFAASALKNATRFACAERLYMQDDLTQLRNSRFLRQFLDNEFRRVRRYGGQVAVIFIDLDGFKEVNDQFGHRVGSETLKVTAGLLIESVRDTDVVTRYGGDEFTIILPNTGAENATITAERIRQKLADHVFPGAGDKTFRLTASFGIAAYPGCIAQSYMDLLEKADFAMYEAKADNKNNVKLATS